jgi:hypothetical protein
MGYEYVEISSLPIRLLLHFRSSSPEKVLGPSQLPKINKSILVEESRNGIGLMEEAPS